MVGWKVTKDDPCAVTGKAVRFCPKFGARVVLPPAVFPPTVPLPVVPLPVVEPVVDPLVVLPVVLLPVVDPVVVPVVLDPLVVLPVVPLPVVDPVVLPVVVDPVVDPPVVLPVVDPVVEAAGRRGTRSCCPTKIASGLARQLPDVSSPAVLLIRAAIVPRVSPDWTV